jgi:hypothetical protein
MNVGNLAMWFITFLNKAGAGLSSGRMRMDGRTDGRMDEDDGC